MKLIVASLTDPEAFGELYRRHARVVLAYFLHWSRSPELAADLTAETFAAAFGSLSGYRSERGEPRAWLFGIAQITFPGGGGGGPTDIRGRIWSDRLDAVRGQTWCPGTYHVSVTVMDLGRAGHLKHPARSFGIAPFTVHG